MCACVPAAIRLCADGGANRVFAALPPELRSSVLPDCIVGDLDSARDDVLQFYRQLGVPVVHETEQVSTDLQKAIRQLARLIDADTNAAASAIKHVVIYGAFGGRFDQLIGNTVTLHTHQQYLPPTTQLLLLSEGNLAQLIPPGRHSIVGHRHFEGAGTHCGLMALQGDVAAVWTSGLEWDMTGQRMGWDAIMSTSNVIASNKDSVVTVSSEGGQLVWTTEFSAARGDVALKPADDA